MSRLTLLTPTVAMGTAMKNRVPDRVKPSFVIFVLTSGHSDAQDSCTRMTTVGVKGLTKQDAWVIISA